MTGANGALSKTVKGLADVTTVHGLRYALRSNSPYSFDRILWTVIVVSATIAVLVTSWSLYSGWQAHPVMTTIGNVSLPISELDFPAITICTPGNDLQSLYKVHQVLFEEWEVRRY